MVSEHSIFTNAKKVVINNKEVKSIKLTNGGVIWEKPNIEHDFFYDIFFKKNDSDFHINSDDEFIYGLSYPEVIVFKTEQEFPMDEAPQYEITFNGYDYSPNTPMIEDIISTVWDMDGNVDQYILNLNGFFSPITTNTLYEDILVENYGTYPLTFTYTPLPETFEEDLSPITFTKDINIPNKLALSVEGNNIVIGRYECCMLFDDGNNGTETTSVINWGDGTIESIDLAMPITHKYTDGNPTHIISFKDPVIRLGDGCFIGCSGLTSINIPDSVTELGANCFKGCSGLTSINIPDSVTELGAGCFIRCNNLLMYRLNWTTSPIPYDSSKILIINDGTKFIIPVNTGQIYESNSYLFESLYYSINGKITWEDDSPNSRPSSVAVYVLRNGEVLTEISCSAKTHWVYNIPLLPAFDSGGNAYTYTVRINNVNGYYSRLISIEEIKLYYFSTPEPGVPM